MAKVMSPPSKIHVLHGFRPLANSLRIYNLENFNPKIGGRALGRNIFRAIVCAVFYVSVISVVIFNCWRSYQPELPWNERAYHLAIMLCFVQQVAIFTSMNKNNRQIIDVFDQLQKVVDSRE